MLPFKTLQIDVGKIRNTVMVGAHEVYLLFAKTASAVNLETSPSWTLIITIAFWIILLLAILTRGKIFSGARLLLFPIRVVLFPLILASRAATRALIHSKSGKSILRFFRQFRTRQMTRRTSAKARGAVGASGFSALIRYFRPKTATDRALEYIDVRQKITMEAARLSIAEFKSRRQEASEKGVESKDLPEFGEALDIFKEKEVQLWDETKNNILREEREIFYQLYKREIHDQILDAADSESIGDLDITQIPFEKLDYTLIGDTVNEEGLYDGALAQEKSMLKEVGLFFKGIEADPEFWPDRNTTFTIEEAEKNYLIASKFYYIDVPIHTDPDLLYEDVSDSFIVNMFGWSDKRIFFYLNEVRKIVNENVARLSVFVYTLVALFLIINILHSQFPNRWDVYSYIADKSFQVSIIGYVFDSEQLREIVNRIVFTLITFTGIVLFILAIYNWPYKHFQAINRVRMSEIISNYSMGIKNNYVRAESEARGIATGGEISPEVQEQAKIYVTNMHWMALRFFFLENFFRSIMYQIRRNCGYYIVGVPAMVILLVYLSYELLRTSFDIDVIPDINPNALFILSKEELIINAILITLLFILGIYVAWFKVLRNSVSHVLQLETSAWPSFSSLAVEREVANLISHYVGEIYALRRMWKSQ